MGQFSWYTQDTNHRIINGEPFKVIMTDDKGNKYIENQYEGYGVFGGKDYYELLAEMNGLGSDRNAGITLAFKNSPIGMNPDVKHPSISESGEYFNGAAPTPDNEQGFSCSEYESCDYDDDEW